MFGALIAALVAPVSQSSAAITGYTRVTGVSSPMFTTFAPGDPTRLFIAERGGSGNNVTANIRVVDLTTGVTQTTPYLSVTGVNGGGEGGLLGLAFHPDFMTNGKLYTYTTGDDSDPSTAFTSYIREYTAPSPTANTIPSSVVPRPILQWGQPQNNHNGGFIGFSPKDDYLYIMSGDGGNGNDQGTGHTEPGGNAQDLTNNLLGKVLRIDVDRDDFTTDATRNYGIPHDVFENGALATPGNPFAPDAPGSADPTGDNEIWSFGLRNPFRAGFDRATGDLWIGDVGQGRREEINFQPASSTGGEHYGWRAREGFIQTPGVGGPLTAAMTQPVWDYKSPGSPDLTAADTGFTGRAVAGGVPYRGPDPTLQGVYFFADSVSNQIWTLRLPNGTQPLDVDNITSMFNSAGSSTPVAISEDASGNLYVTYLSGTVFRINTSEVTPGDFNRDAMVDSADLSLWQANFGKPTSPVPIAGDSDADGDVDGADFLNWQRNAGWSALNVPPGSAAVPEPAAAVLLSVALIYIARPSWPGARARLARLCN